ncbi:uncharacterized protein LOC120207919, partial [Hibiscus syriacus]|uniref:uncharacterized protein LOC120207919 n=1 Tax=Hibiscus syriacus TaxID=106335 RepID=UPI001923A72A
IWRAGESLKEEDRDYEPCCRRRFGKEGESLKEAKGENKSCNTNRRRQSKSLCPSNIKPVEAKEGVENKRVCLRRQSARFKPQESEMTEDVFMVDNTNFFQKEPDEECMIPGNEAQELRRHLRAGLCAEQLRRSNPTRK